MNCHGNGCLVHLSTLKNLNMIDEFFGKKWDVYNNKCI
jgi:hypothetical protein